MRFLSGVLLALLILGGQSGAHAAEESLRADPRLAAPVSVYRQSLLLGDLLALISEKTGAQVRTSPSDAALAPLN